MQSPLKEKFPTVVWRHRKENLKKCSLHGLEGRDDFCFFSYPNQELPALDGYLLLTLDAPPLKQEEAGRGLLVLDATWRYAEKMLARLETTKLQKRSLPGNIVTAYPRCQTGCFNPDAGLASIEAIYVAYKILGQDTTGLLDHYYWRDSFLKNLTSTLH